MCVLRREAAMSAAPRPAFIDLSCGCIKTPSVDHPDSEPSGLRGVRNLESRKRDVIVALLRQIWVISAPVGLHGSGLESSDVVWLHNGTEPRVHSAFHLSDPFQ